MLRKAAPLLVLALALLLGAGQALSIVPQAAADTPAQRTVEAERLASPITVDGDLDDWPPGPAQILDTTTAQYAAGNIASPADLSASVRAAWDETFLYVAATITDNILLADSSSIWDDDSLEIAIDGAYDARCCSVDDHQFTIVVDGRLADFGVVIRPGTSQVVAAVQQGGAGFRFELAIPLTGLTGRPIVSGTVMGLNLGLNDDDDGGRRDKRLVWSGNSTLDVTNFGRLVFIGETPQPPAGTATPTRTPTPSATPTPPVSTPTRTPTATSPATATATATATPTVAGQPTSSVDERLASLESNLDTLEGRIRSILDILQRAGRFPDASGLAVATQVVQTGGDPLAYFRAVNCGGPAYTTISGTFYAADQPYTAGSWGYRSGQSTLVLNAIADTEDDTLYQSERFNLTGYAFDVPAGTYELTLRFAEIYQYALKGGRIFDVRVEDQVVIDDLDIMARVGPYTALDLSFTVQVLDGQLNIDFVASAGVPKISAIEVRGIGPTGPTPTPSLNDRLGLVSAKLTELEVLVGAILDIFAATREGTPTPTAVSTPAPTPTRTPTVSGPTPTRTPTPSGPTPTPKTTYKKGIGGGDNPEHLRELGVSWGYIWYIAANNFNTVYEHVPMIYGKDYSPTTVATVASAHPGSYWLIWNEPDYWQQANISPREAAQLYRALRPLIKAADPTAKLIVGGVFNLNVTWLQEFRSEYRQLYNEWPIVEGWHVHHYVGRDEYNRDTWRTRLEAVRTWMLANGGAVELWLTEFGCLNSDAVARQIMADQVPWLEAQPWITRYAWYAAYASGVGCPNCTGSLLNADGTLTDLGRLYRTLP